MYDLCRYHVEVMKGVRLGHFFGVFVGVKEVDPRLPRGYYPKGEFKSTHWPQLRLFPLD